MAAHAQILCADTTVRAVPLCCVRFARILRVISYKVLLECDSRSLVPGIVQKVDDRAPQSQLSTMVLYDVRVEP